MPRDFVINAADDAALAAKLIDAGAMKGGEGGWLATDGVLLSYIGEADDPDSKLAVKPKLAGRHCFVGIDDGNANGPAIEAKLNASKTKTTTPLRVRAGGALIAN